MLTITFIEAWPKPWRDAAERVFAALQAGAGDLPEGNINLKLVDADESKALNEQYSGNAYPTDVLTFNYQEDGAREELADIVINRELVGDQAAAAGISPENELALLALHGLLHALGYDHQTAEAQQQLDGRQRTIMEQAGFTYRNIDWKD